MLDAIEARFRECAPRAGFWSLRVVDERDESLCVRRDVVEPPRLWRDSGAMVSVVDGGGIGYGATSDLSVAGLRRAAERALEWARRSAGRTTAEFSALPRPQASGEFSAPALRPWDATPLGEKLDRLRERSKVLGADDRILDWHAALWHSERDTLLLTSDGARIRQRYAMLLPELSATAHAAGETQRRSFGGDAYARQGGLEILDDVGFDAAAPRIAEEALELLAAPDCPTGRTALLLAPDQMILQLHESIGHPLELDRILGDERNYAGTSFVTPEMFGSYRYGSELLNVVFEPDRPGELASYAFDDEGLPAERAVLIDRGVLVRGLGGATSQARSGLPGVASSRATSWNRPPIDRMANLNIEPGSQRFEELVAGVERGVYMQTNCSWSIDHERNKFQFGCERARLIEDGRLGPVVKKPNYRGRSADFWRSLVGVGDASTHEVLGSPYCGKGEPNQLIRVGHATPACLFADVEVFGGA